jgi:PPM family protein phosphatase
MTDAATEKPFNPLPGPITASKGIRFAMHSHPGRARAYNQDACAAAPEHDIFVVCDGMGGAAAGEIASKLATDAFLEAASHSATQHALVAATGSITSAANCPQIQLEQGVAAANGAVHQRAESYRALRGMGTTLVAALIHSSEARCSAWTANVGDSRCYLLRDKVLRQLTTDHSVVEEQIQAGILSRQQAEFSPVRNVITRAIGTQSEVAADILEHPLQSGDILLLASDGLTRELTEEEIASILIPSCSLDAASEALIEAANARGGRDNITVLLVARD